MSERILVIGFEAEHPLVDRAGFESDLSLAGYAHGVVDPGEVSALLSRLSGGVAGQGAEARAESAGRLAQAIRRRRTEATELLRGGGTLLCFLRPLGPPVQVVWPGTRGATILHAYSWLPEEPSLTRLVIASQQEHALRPADEGHPAWELIRAQGPRGARSEACVTNEPPAPEWHAVATDPRGRLVAFEVRVGQGRLIFAPPLAAESAAEGGTLLARFFERLSGASRPAAEPEWVWELALPGEAELRDRASGLEREIERLEAEFLDVRSKRAELVELHRLVTARLGNELAGATAKAFARLGFEVERVEPELLRLRSGEGEAMVTVAAAEGSIDSDPYWALVRRMGEGTGRQVRGVIVGNAFCSQAPSARGAPFSDLLRRGAQHRDVCLLASTELHAAVAASLVSPENEALRQRLRKAILETTGPCELKLLLGREERPTETPR
jgi:uncharacterized small protein (DUF1192 family)